MPAVVEGEEEGRALIRQEGEVAPVARGDDAERTVGCGLRSFTKHSTDIRGERNDVRSKVPSVGRIFLAHG
jgi:hypothetical protein